MNNHESMMMRETRCMERPAPSICEYNENHREMYLEYLLGMHDVHELWTHVETILVREFNSSVVPSNVGLETMSINDIYVAMNLVANISVLAPSSSGDAQLSMIRKLKDFFHNSFALQSRPAYSFAESEYAKSEKRQKLRSLRAEYKALLLVQPDDTTSAHI